MRRVLNVGRPHTLVLVLAFVVSLLLSVGSAQAHSSPTEALPGPGEEVSEVTVLRLTFPIELDPNGDHSLLISTVEGELLPVEETVQVNSFTIEAQVTEPLPGPGRYVVRYLAFEIEEGPLSFADGGYQFFYEPVQESSTNWLAFGIFGAVLVGGGGLIARRRGLI